MLEANSGERRRLSSHISANRLLSALRRSASEAFAGTCAAGAAFSCAACCAASFWTDLGKVCAVAGMLGIKSSAKERTTDRRRFFISVNEGSAGFRCDRNRKIIVVVSPSDVLSKAAGGSSVSMPAETEAPGSGVAVAVAGVEQAIQRGAADTQQTRGAKLVAVDPVEHQVNV